MSNASGRLYVVATPIGNQGDIGERAQRIMTDVSWIAAEDTRHTGRFLDRLGISAQLISLHEHNEQARIELISERLGSGSSVALVCDAGTPLISDPGYRLVRELRSRGLSVEAVPGPCSITAALSVAGLPTDRFVYEGFLPSKQSARRQRLEVLSEETRTLVLLESSHRIQASVRDMAAAFGEEREAAICRELTKSHETVRLASFGELQDWLAEDPNQRRGEFVVVAAGAQPAPSSQGIDPEAERVLGVLAAELPTKQAASLAARITGASRNALYARAVAQADPSD